jgi:hypothetical protein
VKASICTLAVPGEHFLHVKPVTNGFFPEIVEPLPCCSHQIELEVSNCKEEAKWAQRAKVKHVQEGGNNTRYFHLIANGKHRKKKIFQLEQD